MKNLEIVRYKNVKYICLEVDNILCSDCIISCKMCDGYKYCYNMEEQEFKSAVGRCSDEQRNDEKNVIFKEVTNV